MKTLKWLSGMWARLLGPSQRELDGRAASDCESGAPIVAERAEDKWERWLRAQALHIPADLWDSYSDAELKLLEARQQRGPTMQAQQLEAELKSYRAQVAELKAENQRLRMSEAARLNDEGSRRMMQREFDAVPAPAGADDTGYTSNLLNRMFWVNAIRRRNGGASGRAGIMGM